MKFNISNNLFSIKVLTFLASIFLVADYAEATDSVEKYRDYNKSKVAIPKAARLATVIIEPPIAYHESRAENFTEHTLIHGGCIYTTSNLSRIHGIIKILKSVDIKININSFESENINIDHPRSAIFLTQANGNEVKFFFSGNWENKNIIEGELFSQSPPMPDMPDMYDIVHNMDIAFLNLKLITAKKALPQKLIEWVSNQDTLVFKGPSVIRFKCENYIRNSAYEKI